MCSLNFSKLTQKQEKLVAHTYDLIETNVFMEVIKQNKERMELNRSLAEEAPPVYFLFFASQIR